MATPALTHFAQRIYDALDPLTYDDANQGYSLAYFCSAIATMFDQVQGYVETRDDGTPGWGALMNADSAPVEVLPWLGQFVGVQVPDGLTEDQQRALVKDVGGFRRGTVASLIAAAQQYLTGTKSVTVLERYGSPYHLRISTRTAETANQTLVLNALMAQKPAGIVMDYVTLAGGDFNTLRDTNVSFNAVKASYKDFNEVKLHPNKRSTWSYADVSNVATGGEATYAAVVTDYTNYLDLLTPTS